MLTRASAIWDRLKPIIDGPVRDPRGPLVIPPDHVFQPAGPQPAPSDPSPSQPMGPSQPDRIEPQAGYVGIRINQLYLHHVRRWFTEIEPVVYSTTEFLYGNATRTDAVVIGPKKDDKLPPGMVLQNTSVFGIHPYRGDDLSHTIVLSRMPTSDVARSLIEVVQSVGSALDPSASVATWTKLGTVVLDGFEKLVGTAGVVPLIGARITLNPDRREPLRPGYIALIDQPGIDRNELWVADSQLLRGPSAAIAQPYRDSDFVLYEITAVPGGMRRDIDRLPFKPLWDEAVEAATKSSDNAWDQAKACLGTLMTAIYRSPDLIQVQRRSLVDQYIADLKALHDETVRLSHLAGSEESESERALRRQVAEVLRLP